MRLRDQRGSALVEFTWLAILLMVPLLYIVLAVFEVQGACVHRGPERGRSQERRRGGRGSRAR